MSADAALLHFFIRTSVKIFILLSVLIYVVGLLRASLDVEKVRRFLEGKNSLLGYLGGAIFGAVTPFCSCFAIPIFTAFTASGIPIGVTIAFLVTSPLINEVALVLFISEFGIGFTTVYVMMCFFSGVLAGALFDFIKAEKFVYTEIHLAKESDKNLLLSKEKVGITFKQRNLLVNQRVLKSYPMFVDMDSFKYCCLCIFSCISISSSCGKAYENRFLVCASCRCYWNTIMLKPRSNCTTCKDTYVEGISLRNSYCFYNVSYCCKSSGVYAT